MANEVEIVIRGIDQASGAIDGVAGKLGALGIAGAAAFAAIAAAATAALAIGAKAVAMSFDWGEKIDRLGDVTGMSADKLASWAFIAEKAGVPIDTLSRSMVIMEKGLTNQAGGLDAVGKSLEKYGISVFDANKNVKDQSALMDEIATKYASFGTQQERVNFLSDVFGRQGAQLVDVFDTLAQEGGIDKVTKKVEALGLVVDATQYEGIQRSMNEIGLTFTGLANAFTGPMLPGLERIVDLFKGWLQDPRVLEGVKRIGDFMGGLANSAASGLAQLPSILAGIANGFLPIIQKAEYFWSLLTTPGQAGNLGVIIGQFINSITEGIKNFDWGKLGLQIHDVLVKVFGGVNQGGNVFNQLLDGMIKTVNWGALALALGNGIASLIAGILGGNWDEIKKQWSDNWNQLVEIVGKIKDIIIGKVGEFLDAGKALIRGIVDGFLGGVGGAISDIQKAVGSIVGAAWAALGGGQPSHSLGGPTGGRVPISHHAAGGWGEGLSVIDEMGPEVVALPSGSYVYSASESARMAGGGSIVFNFPHYLGTPQELKQAMQSAVREMQLDGRVPS